ncbi:MAG: hypothetical protein M1299_07230 [Firmicutes bacterium]|nr:hypothetical protein [Bacillota bacterium]
MAKFAILADDLTGANLTGGFLFQQGWKMLVVVDFQQLGLIDLEPYDAVIVNTYSRGLDPEVARERAATACRGLLRRGLQQIGKRIDSSLRGNIGAEVEGVLDALGPGSVALVVPAYPSARRITRGGHHYLNGLPLHQTDAGRDPQNPVLTSFVPEIIARQTRLPWSLILHQDLASNLHLRLKRELQAGVRLLLFDATSDEEIGVIAEAVYRAGLFPRSRQGWGQADGQGRPDGGQDHIFEHTTDDEGRLSLPQVPEQMALHRPPEQSSLPQVPEQMALHRPPEQSSLPQVPEQSPFHQPPEQSFLPEAPKQARHGPFPKPGANDDRAVQEKRALAAGPGAVMCVPVDPGPFTRALLGKVGPGHSSFPGARGESIAQRASLSYHRLAPLPMAARSEENITMGTIFKLEPPSSNTLGNDPPRVLVVAGSATPLTRRQLDYLVEKTGAKFLPLDPDDLFIADKQKEEAWAEKLWRLGQETSVFGLRLILSEGQATHLQTDPEKCKVTADGRVLGNGPGADLRTDLQRRRVTPQTKAAAIVSTLGRIASSALARGITGLRGVYLTGGDTAFVFCQAAGVLAIELLGGVTPPLGHGRLAGGLLSGLPILTKGGLQGDETTAYRCIEFLLKQ